jgi:hypothetical protein
MTRLTSRLRRLTVVMTMLLASAFLNIGPAFGQATSTGTVVGVVTDATGAIIPGANITLTDVTTKAIRQTVTNKDGQFVLQDVTPGTYDISAANAGFSTDVISSQVISVGTQTTANFRMSVGSQTTTVEVQAASTDLQTLNATVGSAVTPNEIESLPSTGRDVTTFATLQPGVSPAGSVAGTVVDQATFQLDGGNNSSDMDGSMLNYTGAFGGNPTGINALGAGASGVMPMPQDSIQEFKVNVVNQTSDFDNASGSQVEVITKRGTNHWHGTVYEYYLDSNIGANTWSNNLTNTPKASYHYSRFGAAAGGPILPNLLGGKTYFFANYEGWRWPNSATYERTVPSQNMRNGILTFSGVNYNLKNYDPRGIGIAPVVQQMYNTQMPVGNDVACSGISGVRCDGINVIGYKANVPLPQKSDFGVARLDHDFGSKWHFMMSYRYFKLTKATTNQVDIGGTLPGDKLNVPTALANRPQDPWYFVAGLTTNISSTFTNDLHYSYLRNIWSWADANAPAQLSGLGGALEPFGESSPTQVLSPYNVDTQDIRTRFWDGHDHFIRDDLTKLKGNHLVQFGGQYQHNFAFHQRTDNGGGINFTTTYQLGDSSGGGLVSLPGLAAAGVPVSSTTNARMVDAVLGIVTDAQVAYTRTGNNLTLNAPLTPAQDQATIPFYNLYASDTWHAKPSLTVNYGLGWALEMPPLEATGKQVALVDASDELVKTDDYLAQRKAAALRGTVYNPQVGFALVGNVGNGIKYPFNPFYASFSPRLSVAWNPDFGTQNLMGRMLGGSSTVIRGGYGRVYGRLNGVGLVLTPLLGPGLIQAVQCRTALSTGVCGSSNPTDTTAFRIGVDGGSAPLSASPVTNTLPQPLYPGFNGAAAASAQVIDPSFRPNDVDSFNLTIQRQVNRKMLVEVGYIGRLIHHEFNPINIDSVPYMMSLGGQSFANAYAAIATAFGCATSASLCSATTAKATAKTPVYPTVSAQPFFETALAGTGYCNGYANCTTAVVQKEANNLGNQKVFALWSDLDNGGFNFARTMMGTPISGSALGSGGQIGSGVSLATATGYGNYNGGFVTFKITDFHGLTLNENFTYSKALGTNAEAQASSALTMNDAFDIKKSYGVQTFDQKYVFNTFMVYQTPWFKGQSGLLGRAAGGWIIAPIFTAGSGVPLGCATNSGSQSFGGSDDLNFSATEQCVFTTPYTGGYHTHRAVVGSVDSNGISVGTSAQASAAAHGSFSAINLFANPAAVFDTIRPPILGIDEKNSGNGPISGLPYWNMDLSIRKNFKIWESYSLEFSGVMTNVFNHLDFANPTTSLASSTTFGVVSSQGNAPRSIEMGVRFSF